MYFKDDNGSIPDHVPTGIIKFTGHSKDSPYGKYTCAAISGSIDDPGNGSGELEFATYYKTKMTSSMYLRSILYAS